MLDITSPTLLNLPYDIRFLIYQHLFPSQQHIFIQAGRKSLVAITEDSSICTEILRTSRFLHGEASSYLYNNYLFHVVGQKQDCLANYEKFKQTMSRHATSTVHVHPLSNGAHSQTCAILMHTGDARLPRVKARGRGVPVSLEALRQEVQPGAEGVDQGFRRSSAWFRAESGAGTAASICVALMLGVLAWALSGWKTVLLRAIER